MQVGITVQVGKILKINKLAEWNKAVQVGITVQVGKNLKINKRAEWNKAVQVGIFEILLL